MAEFIEQEMQDNSSYDCMQVIDETEKILQKSKPVVPLRPVLPNLANQLTQWPMINLRAKEAERAALMFQKQKGIDEARGDEKFFDAQEF
jgi:hypothetical protein